MVWSTTKRIVSISHTLLERSTRKWSILMSKRQRRRRKMLDNGKGGLFQSQGMKMGWRSQLIMLISPSKLSSSMQEIAKTYPIISRHKKRTRRRKKMRKIWRERGAEMVWMSCGLLLNFLVETIPFYFRYNGSLSSCCNPWSFFILLPTYCFD